MTDFVSVTHHENVIVPDCRSNRQPGPQRIGGALAELHRTQIVLSGGLTADQRLAQIQVQLLEKLLARIGESAALTKMALAFIERQEPMPEHSANGAVDRAWLLAMGRLAGQSGNGTLETIRAFIAAKMQELE